MPKFGWRFGPKGQYYYTAKEVDRDKVEADTRDALAKVKKGDAWTDPRGVKHIPLLLDGDIVGNLWEDVPLSDLKVGSYWAAAWGSKVELVHQDRVVGMLWLAA